MTFYHAIIPVAGTNGAINPSAEYNATGWAGTATGTATRQAGTAAFGAWAIAGTVGNGAGSGVTYGTLNQAAGSYTVSAYVYGGSGSVYSIGIKGTGAGAAFVGSVAGTTGGTWHRYSFAYGESGAANRLFAVVNRSAGGAPFLVDGVMVAGGTNLTTYLDGDQDGCVWQGAPHASSSSRSGTSRQGGTVVSLQSLGLTVLEHGGVGMPPVANITQEYALADGALWQRQRATSRMLTITGLFSGTTWQGLHARRAAIVNLLKIDAAPNPQPVRLLYTGAGGTSTIDAYYDGGMQFDSRSGFSETAAVRLLATDPYWYSTTDEGTALAAQVNLGSTNFAAYRDPNGQWGTLGQAGTTFSGFIFNIGVRTILTTPNGTVFFGGDFGTAGGTKAPGVAMYFPTLKQFGTLTGGTIVDSGADVVTLARSPSGTLFVGGGFQGVAGTAGANFVAQWNGAWGTLTGGTPNSIVWALTYAPTGTLFLSGELTQVAGTTSGGAAMWLGPRFGTLAGGTINPTRDVGMTYGPDNALYVYASNNSSTARGSAVYKWNGVWGTNGGAFAGNGLAVRELKFGPDGVLYAGGDYITAPGVGTVNGIARWNGAQWQTLNGTLDLSGAIWSLAPTANGQVWMGGSFTSAGGLTNIPDALTRWNGNVFIPVDIDIPAGTFAGLPQVAAIAEDNLGGIYIAGNFRGTATAAAVASIVNDGAANAYPVLVLRNSAASPVPLYQFTNNSTGDGVWFNVSILPGETMRLDLRNNEKTFSSDFRGNILGGIVPGSNLTTWRLTPGTNSVSFFAGSTSVEAAIYWRPRAWSDDAIL